MTLPPLPPLPTPPAPAVKPGYLTSEFYLHIAVGIAIFVLTRLQENTAGFPPLVQGAIGLVAPLALAWLAKSYSDGRADVKTAASNAGAAASNAVASTAAAAAVMRSPGA